MTFIDAHCHLADPRFDSHRAQVIARARQLDIHYFIQGGVGPEDWQRQCNFNDGSWFTCFGLHPWYIATHPQTVCEDGLHQLKRDLGKAIALGECGLDFSQRTTQASHERQQVFFEAQLAIARDFNKPLVLHVVRSHGEVLGKLRTMGGTWRGIVHGFSGSYEVARAYINLGLSISIGGALTRQGYHKLKDAVSRIPRDQLVVESDAPDMAPTDWGQPQNEPASLWLVAKAIGYFHHLMPRDVLMQSRRNLCRIFDLEL